MPLRSGWSKQTIDANIAELMDAGNARDSAIYVAYAAARKSWFAAHPRGHLLYELAWPKTARKKSDYDRDGRPLELESALQTVRGNPRPAMPSDLPRAVRLYKGFTGKAPRTVRKLAIRPMPKSGLAIGKVFGIMYSVDATGERFRHVFKGKARPTLIVGSDGKSVYLRGGAYTFTERGFVDKK